jgi:hypothetical protein
MSHRNIAADFTYHGPQRNDSVSWHALICQSPGVMEE